MPLSDAEHTASQNGSSVLAASSIAKRKSRYSLPLIIQREFLTRVQQRSFQVVTIVLMLIIVLGASFPTILALLTAKSQTKITIVNTAGKIGSLDDQGLRDFLNKSLNTNYDGSQESDQKARFALRLAPSEELTTLRQQVQANQLSVLLQIDRNSAKDLTFTYYTSEPLAQNTDLSQIQATATQLYIQDRLAKFGLSNDQAQSLFTQPTFTATSTLQEQSSRTPAESSAAVVIAMFTIVLLFVFIQQYCSTVSTGVAEEKGSRIMEILINATTPFQLLLGKVIGVGLAGATQMGLVCLAGIVALLAQTPLKTALGVSANSSTALPSFTSLSLGALGLLVLFFVLGYLLYASLYAAAGALVSRQEEVASSVGPLGFLLMAAYLISFYSVITPRADWIIPLSYVPFFTPMMMLARNAVTPLAWWEIALSCLLMIVSILLLTWLAAYIYRVGVLMYGQKPGFGAFFRYIRSSRNVSIR